MADVYVDAYAIANTTPIAACGAASTLKRDEAVSVIAIVTHTDASGYRQTAQAARSARQYGYTRMQLCFHHSEFNLISSSALRDWVQYKGARTFVSEGTELYQVTMTTLRALGCARV